MGISSSCWQFFISKKNDSTIKLAEIDTQLDKTRKEINTNKKTSGRSHLNLFLKNLPKKFPEYRGINNQDRLFVIERSRNISPTASFTSITYPVISSSFYNSKNILATTSSTERNLENDSRNEFDNFESNQFNSPEFYLVGMCTPACDVEPYAMNVNQQAISCENNYDKRGFGLNQVNQVNIDGFEWDLV